MHERLEKFLKLCHQGDLERQQGNLDEAIIKFTEADAYAREVGYDDKSALFQRALTYRLKSDLRSASADFTELGEPFFQMHVHFYHGCTLAAARDFKKAQSAFELVIRLCLRPRFACDYTLSSNTENMRLAVEDITRFIEHDSQSAAAYFNRGLLRRTLEDWVGALDDYRIALALESNNPRLTEWLESQEILQYGLPGKANRGHLKANFDCYNVHFDMFSEYVEVYHFDAVNWETKQVSFQEGETLPAKLFDEQWILLKNVSTLSGSHFYFWRRKAQS